MEVGAVGSEGRVDAGDVGCAVYDVLRSLGALFCHDRASQWKRGRTSWECGCQARESRWRGCWEWKRRFEDCAPRVR